MTADMPDAKEIAREALAKKYDETGWHDQAAYIRDAGNLDTDPLKFAILGARAMQDAMAGRVMVKALEWVEPTKLTNGCWSAECELGVFSVAFDDGWHAELNDGRDWEWEPEMDPRSYEGPYAAQRACQAYRDARILSALEPAGGQEGAAPAIENCGSCGQVIRFHPVTGTRCGCSPTPAPDVPWLVNEDVLANAADNLEAAGFYTSANRVREAWDRIEALQAEVARLTEEADGDFVAAAVRVMREYPGFDARDYEFDGISADDFEQFFSEDMREAWRCAEAAEARATAAEAERDALKAEVERLRKADRACQWYWPENSTESENCADSPQEVVQNAYGWEEPRGDVVAVARGGVVEVTYCAALPPAPDSDSDDEFWVEEATEEAAASKITAELERRAALSPAKAGG